jgi:hypothetical protein
VRTQQQKEAARDEAVMAVTLRDAVAELVDEHLDAAAVHVAAVHRAPALTVAQRQRMAIIALELWRRSK